MMINNPLKALEGPSVMRGGEERSSLWALFNKLSEMGE
jgi:hypothetical protein